GFVPRQQDSSVWVHAVSLGEVRSAVPMITEFLRNGDIIVITCATPAGRREAEKTFSTEIKDARLTVTYMPLDMRWTWSWFLRRMKPKFGLVMEVEFWPMMIATCRRKKVPLMLCNGQYPGKSFAKDRANHAMRIMLPSGFAGVMVKSEMLADRFRSIGCTNIAVTGELRFEQPLPLEVIAAGEMLKASIHRPVITIASVVKGEDEVFIPALQQVMNLDPKPLIVYVPRAPERFNVTAQKLADAGFNVAKRSDVLDAQLKGIPNLSDLDILVGDSLGEMYFYLALADKVIVGGGFVPAGSHNMSEALALGKPVVLGPNIHTIEYPATEALANDAAIQVRHQSDLIDAIVCTKQRMRPDPTVVKFFAAHSGAVAKTMAAIPQLIAKYRDT
ncbi:MAG: 3-deoxy-D-manno-octulosonic acid transferase, partial [Planktomarina sp.]